jgi:hypothetical protein
MRLLACSKVAQWYTCTVATLSVIVIELHVFAVMGVCIITIVTLQDGLSEAVLS